MTMTFPTPTTVLPTDPHEVVPQKYISVKHTQECVCCNRVHQWCELFAFTESPSRWGFKKITHYHRLDWPKYRIPIEQWDDPDTQTLPFCHDCNQPSLMNSADMLDPPPSVRTVLHVYVEPVEKPKPKREPKPVGSVNDIMDLINER